MGSVSHYKTRKVKNFLDAKLQIEWLKGGRELKGWYCIDGKKVLKVFIPHTHGGGSGDSITHDVLRDLKNNLKVTEQEFSDLYECPMSGAEYKNKIRKIPGII